MKIKYDTIIFDCDGVLLDSNQLKIDAFRQVLSDYPQAIVDEFIAYHQRTGGVSRYVKLRAFLTDFLYQKYEEQQLNDLLESFGSACVALYETADLTPGCLDTLKALHVNTALYVASGSDESELRQVFAKKRIDQFFRGIYGSPKTKDESVSEILLKAELAGEVVFIGDAESDWKAAQNHGIDFIFMSQFSDALTFMKKASEAGNFPTIKNLADLVFLD